MNIDREKFLAALLVASAAAAPGCKNELSASKDDTSAHEARVKHPAGTVAPAKEGGVAPAKEGGIAPAKEGGVVPPAREGVVPPAREGLVRPPGPLPLPSKR